LKAKLKSTSLKASGLGLKILSGTGQSHIRKKRSARLRYLRPEGLSFNRWLLSSGDSLTREPFDHQHSKPPHENGRVLRITIEFAIGIAENSVAMISLLKIGREGSLLERFES